MLSNMSLKLFFNTSTIEFSYFFVLCIWIICINVTNTGYNRPVTKRFYGPYRLSTTGNPVTHKICTHVDNMMKARHQSCFLRPDTGPCRADIIQWYFDPRQRRCFRFYWGGCQGNGNRFETKQECKDYCFLNSTSVKSEIPHFCSLTFEYGDCFGYFHRWGWDKLTKSCKRYMYSGCGGNQNNFQTNIECMNTCISPPNNTLFRSAQQYTTCMPVYIPDFQ